MNAPKSVTFFYSSFHSVTYVNLSKQFFLFFSTFSNKKLSSVTDHTISSRIKLADYEFNFLSLIFAQVFSYVSETRLAGMNTLLLHQLLRLIRRQESELQELLILHDSRMLLLIFHCLFLLQSLLYVSRTCPSPSFTFRTFCAHLITNRYNCCKINVCFVSILISCNDTVCFVAYIQDDFIRFNVDDCTIYNLSISYCLKDSSNICSKVNSDIILNLLTYFIGRGCPCCNTY